jgi:hypothetical protein
VSTPWFPLATVCADVDSAKGALQAADPPMLVETEAQDTVTAEIGTVGQFVKLAELACTVSPQAPCVKSKFCQLNDAVELPASTGAESGSVALKVMVAGVAVMVKLAAGIAAAPGRRRPVAGGGGAGRTATGGPAAASIIVMDNQAPIRFA